jgi:hypothetical protein
MPQIGHRIGQGFERVVQRTEAFEAQQQAPELVFPGKHALDGAKAFVKNGGIEQRLAAAPGCFPGARIGVDVGRHAAIEDGLAVRSAIVDAVETEDGAAQREADGASDARDLRQCVAQQRRFIAVAWRRNERRDHVAVPIAEGDDLVALDLLVATEAEVVAAFLCRGRRAVAVDDVGVEQIGRMQRGDRTGEDPVKTALRLPVPEHPVNARVMNFRTAVPICCDRQFLPLATHVQQPQEVVEDRMQRQFRRRTAAPHDQMGQDKLGELREAQMGGNPLPLLAFRHIDRQSDRILAQFMTRATIADRLRVPDKFSAKKNPQSVAGNNGTEKSPIKSLYKGVI